MNNPDATGARPPRRAAPGRGKPRWIAIGATAAALAIPVVVIASLYVSTIATKDFASPVGFDAPKYVWRTNLVQAEGLDALAGSAPEPFRVNADRPGFPSLVSAVASVLGTSPARVVLVLPAVLAVAVGLAAGGLAIRSLQQPWWAFAVFAVACGASIQVSRMAGPAYLDNLLLAPLAVAATGLALSAAGRGRGTAGAVVLLTAGWLVHWVFAALLVGLLGAAGLVLLPGSLRERGPGRPFVATEAGRLLAIATGGGVLGVAALLGLSSTEPSPPRLPRSSFLSKLAADVRAYVFSVLGPIAAIGAFALWRSTDPGRRARLRTLVVMLMWAASGGVAVLALEVGFGVPAHRFLAFGLGVPILFAAGTLAIADRAARWGRRLGTWVGAAIVVGGLGAGVTIAYGGWFRSHPWMPRSQLAQAAEAGAYLRTVDAQGPVVFLVDLGGHSPLSGTSLAFHVIRSALPPDLVSRTLVYLGEPDAFLQGRPTMREVPESFDEASLRHWPSVRAILDQDPIALLMPAFNISFRSSIEEHPEWMVGPTLAVVQGPRPSTGRSPTPPPPGPLSTPRLIVLWGAVLAVLLAAGSGWAVALSPGGALERIGDAPALGIAVLVLGTVVAGRVGVVLGTGASAALVALVVAAGWAVALVRRRRGSMSDDS